MQIKPEPIEEMVQTEVEEMESREYMAHREHDYNILVTSGLPTKSSKSATKITSEENEYDFYSKMVGIRLNKMKPEQSHIAERLINDILYEGTLEGLTKSSYFVADPTRNSISSNTITTTSRSSENETVLILKKFT